ncbi:MAG: methyltransferase, partial [Gammaproteobacteria bacterium]|nr:methyltransferase [Gammaproteobacteria bacterium]
DNDLLHDDISLLIINDGFGALSVALSHYRPVVMTDSYLSMQAISQNLKINDLDYDSVTIINSLHAPDSVLDKTADLVIIKIPKSLAMLEDQLYRIRSALDGSTKIIATGMTKRIHTSTMSLFEKIIGPTRTSLAHKKSRLIFCEFDTSLTPCENPYPDSYELGYQLDDVELEMINHAGVYSRDKLDTGTRLFIENLPADERYKTIVDLGCGNGVLGLMAAIKNPAAKMIFSDESYMAVDSSIDNFTKIFGESREAEFLQTDCLYGVPENSVSLVLCNPPFHQDNAINDDVAWQMFTEAKEVLESKGELWVIGNRHLGYHAKLKHLFGDCEVVASNKKFTLLKAVKA